METAWAIFRVTQNYSRRFVHLQLEFKMLNVNNN
jgi:hypothetical protein